MSSNNYTDSSSLREITLDAEPEPIRRQFYEVPVPAVTYRGNNVLYINTKAAELIAFDYCSISTTPQYVVMQPAVKGSASAFRVSPLKDGKGKMIRVPAELKEKRVAKGSHRLYRFKDGICFKRYETISEEGAENNG